MSPLSSKSLYSLYKVKIKDVSLFVVVLIIKLLKKMKMKMKHVKLCSLYFIANDFKILRLFEASVLMCRLFYKFHILNAIAKHPSIALI